MTPPEFKFAVDGDIFTEFSHRSEHGIDKINGFKMKTMHGMYMEVTSVDHVRMDSIHCDGFEKYSHPDTEIN